MINIALAAASAVAAALIFPKFNLYWLAWLALVPFFLSLYRAKGWREALCCGFIFGVIFFGIHLAWLLTLFRFVSWWIALGWVCLVLFQTLFILLFVWLFRLSRFVDFANALVIALLWTAIEWLRAWGPFGVTGGDLGYSQVQFLPLIQIASFSSVYGVSFLIVLVNVTIADILMEPATKRRGSIIFTIALLIVSLSYGFFVLRGNRPALPAGREVYSQVPEQSLKVALIQPNIDQRDRLDPRKVKTIFNINKQLTQQALQQKPDVVVWPETSLFTYVLHDQALFAEIKELARQTGVWLVMGVPHYVGNKAYNSLISISPSGEVVSRYDKQHLVPFGEYLPFRALLYPFLRGVGYYEGAYDSNPQPQQLKVGKLDLAAAICFESTFPYAIRDRVKPGSAFILLVTNDAWFNDSSALYFHLNCGVFRAIENRKYFIQVGNTGISAVVDPYGRILEELPVNQRQVLIFKVPLS
ncbi:MAG: apolipoprotein N-acyltransferase [Candidatus Margulisbacteria bacterium]|nr:apolipoprotein N-acyltransferase [Candidatus Margulisiibacteriota bacterium]